MHHSHQAVMGIESLDGKLSDFPFPSVTVCSQNKISKRKLEQMMKNPRYKAFNAKQLMLMMRVMIKVDAAFNRNDDLIAITHIAIKNGFTISELINMTIQV